MLAEQVCGPELNPRNIVLNPSVPIQRREMETEPQETCNLVSLVHKTGWP